MNTKTVILNIDHGIFMGILWYIYGHIQMSIWFPISRVDLYLIEFEFNLWGIRSRKVLFAEQVNISKTHQCYC